jgi:8-oxo-dGTP pyrophosphatase MutT (NUDIX family)
MIADLNPNIIRRLLEQELPGEPAQMRMAPEIRRQFPSASDCRNAGVLLMLYPDGKQVRLVFMKRNEYAGPHSGQISFPGGMQEKGEDDLSQTALREAEEETGVPSDRIELLGGLTPLYIPVSKFCVSPFVSWISEPPRFRPDRTEVQYLITPSLDEIMDRTNHGMEKFSHPEGTFESPCIRLGKEIVWGATAMILSEFMALIEKLS